MSHAHARQAFHGRCLLFQRVRFDRRPVSHVAKELGVSRQCAHRWVSRFDSEGWDGLHDRSSRRASMPRCTPERVEAAMVLARQELRAGPGFIAEATGVPERTVTRILRRAGLPRLAECDPLTGQVIRAYRQIFRSNDERSAALAPWLERYDHHRRHTALGGKPPISPVSPT